MKSARERWFERLYAERERRRDGELQTDGRYPRETLLETLAQMRERLAPAGFTLSPADAAESCQQLDRWFRDHGYGRGK
jgi:hypothetical protein